MVLWVAAERPRSGLGHHRGQCGLQVGQAVDESPGDRRQRGSLGGGDGSCGVFEVRAVLQQRADLRPARLGPRPSGDADRSHGGQPEPAPPAAVRVLQHVSPDAGSRGSGRHLEPEPPQRALPRLVTPVRQGAVSGVRRRRRHPVHDETGHDRAAHGQTIGHRTQERVGRCAPAVTGDRRNPCDQALIDRASGQQVGLGG